MASTLQLVDDAGTVLFDFNTSTGTGNPSSLPTAFASGGGMDLLGGAPELTVFSGDSTPGGSIVRRRDPLAEVSWQQVFGTMGTTYDTLAAGIGELARLLSKNGRLKWIPHGSTQTRYIDFEGSAAPVRLLDGREMGLWQAAQQGFLSEGATIALWAYPYLLEDELSPSANKCVNPTLLYDFGGTANRPDDWTWDATTGLSGETIDADHQAYRFVKADGAAANLQQTTAVGSFASGDVVTLSFYAKVLAVAGTPQMRPTVQFKQSDGTTNVGSLHSGTLTTLSTAWQRLSVTTTAAGALTSRAVLSIQVDNGDATSVTMFVRNAQAEVAASATTFRVPAESIAADPASTTRPRRMMVYAGGDAPGRSEVRVTADAQTLQRVTIYRESLNPVDYLKATLHKQAESGTLSNNTSSTADANASGGNTAQTTFALLSGAFGTDDTTTAFDQGNFTVNKPSSTAEGDFLILAVFYPDSTPRPFGYVMPGWKYQGSTQQVAVTSQRGILHILTKVAGPAEPSTYSFRIADQPDDGRAWIMRATNIDTDNPFAFLKFNASTAAGTTATYTGGTTTRDNSLVVAIVGAAHASNTTNPFGTPSGTTPTFTEQDDGNTGVVTSGLAASTGVLATAGATGSPTSTINATSDWLTCLIGLNPAPGPILERVSQTWTSIPPGTYDLWLRCYPTAASKVRIRPRWALQSSPTVFNTMPDYVLDSLDAGAFEYVLVHHDQWRLQVPEEWTIDTLTVEIDLGLEDYATANFRIDWLDLIPSNEVRTAVEAVQSVASTELLVADGELPKVFHLDSTSKLKPFGTADGPVPVMLEPGFNLLTILFQQDIASGFVENKAKLSASPSVAVHPTPAHRT